MVGGEYRREDAFFQADQVIEDNLTFTNPLTQFNPERPFEVKEAFAEVDFPILSGVPFFEELSFSAAGRVSDYTGPIGTTYAYNLGARWSPTPDLLFRANYGRAVRAPNYTDTAGEPNVTFISVTDPCASTRIDQGSEFRRANCEADLGAILDDPGFQQVANATVSTRGLNGNNPDLFEEASISYTIGGVYQPSWLPGFAVTFDYYNIEVEDVIASVAGNTIIATCYDLPDLDNPFCGNFERNGTGIGPEGEEPGQVLQGSILQSPLNFASRIREGIDVDVSYRKSLSEDVFVNARLLYTHVMTSSNFQDPTNPNFENRILGELGDPQNQFVFDLDLTFGAVTFGYGARYIGPQLTTSFEAQNPLNGQPPQNPDASFPLEYPETLYHDIRLAFQIEDAEGEPSFEFFGGVENLLGTNPPLGLTGTGDGSAIFEVFGRRYFAGVRALF
ncbi:TonB dependent receptor [Erythrobacter sp. HL-111]|nr:TonB dependent receptor [Erythrobacter sp. HL-111]